MTVSDLKALWNGRGDQVAIDGHAGAISYGELAVRASSSMDLPKGSVVALVDDFGPEGIARLVALWDQGCVVAPLVDAPDVRFQEQVRILQAEFLVRNGAIEPTGILANHAFYDQLRAENEPGLVLFTSGSTGAPKAVVHRLGPMLNKLGKAGKAHRTLAFLGFDHIGGQNTWLYCLIHGGMLVTVGRRDPSEVVDAMERYGVELLPCSPSFLRLLLLSGALEGADLRSLSLISYGSEPMPASLLAELDRRLPDVRKLQQFGMSELGVLRSQSRGNDSPWVRLGGDEFDLRVVDGALEIWAETAMMGYLNAPSPFTADGWLKTGDLVEQDGEWFRILGRASEMINVGGEKVSPTEVESVIEAMDGIAHVVVRGEANPILGQVVTATVKVSTSDSPDEVRRRVRSHCAQHLPRHMVPQKVFVTDQEISGFKKNRAA